jgi:hypothetical protein
MAPQTIEIARNAAGNGAGLANAQKGEKTSGVERSVSRKLARK